MAWGSFGHIHLLSLLLAVLMIVGLYFVLKKRSQKVQVFVLGILSFSGFAAMIFNLVTWGSPLEYLPFHLCSLNAMVLPFAVFTRNKVLNNLLLFWALGALFALVVNTAQANFEIFSPTFAFYYFPHVLELGIPILMFKLKLVKKELRCILSTVVITVLAYTAVHFINLGVNAYTVANNCLDYAGNVITVNYMYSLQPENPLLQVFYNILPFSYWYMFLAIPIVVVYLTLIYIKQWVAFFRQKRSAK